MEDTGCFAFFLKEMKGESKREATEVDDLLELMFEHVRHGNSQELAIFGPLRNQYSLELKIMALIEEKYQGYYPQTSTNEELESSEGMGIDKVWLDLDFEPNATRTNAEILSAGAGCFVESVGKLVFLAGTKAERQRGKEYIPWVKRKHQTPHVPDLENRRDMVAFTVPKDVLKDKWLATALAKFAKERHVMAFFDDWKDADGSRRLVVAGAEVVKKGSVTKLLEDARGLVDKTLNWSKSGHSDKSADDWWQNSEQKGL